MVSTRTSCRAITTPKPEVEQARQHTPMPLIPALLAIFSGTVVQLACSKNMTGSLLISVSENRYTTLQSGGNPGVIVVVFIFFSR